MSAFDISYMEINDIPESARVLSIAMLNNPLHVAVFEGNGENERLEIEQMFVELFTKRPGIVFLMKEDDKIVGVMRMNSCVGKKPEIDSAEVKVRKETPDRISDRKSVWLAEWALRDPKEQHWHLGPIGVLPTHRRIGIGTTLMERFCEEVDKCGSKAYLETDFDANVGFYMKFGFEIISTSDILGVENRYMIREARSGSLDL